jgi:hypothetical protein
MCFRKIWFTLQSARAILLILVLMWQSLLWLTPVVEARTMGLVPTAKDKSKETLYMFFTLPGNFIAANFTGQ